MNKEETIRKTQTEGYATRHCPMFFKIPTSWKTKKREEPFYVKEDKRYCGDSEIWMWTVLQTNNISMVNFKNLLSDLVREVFRGEGPWSL